MRDRIIVIGLIVIDVALLVLCGYFYMHKDRQKPTISFSTNDVVYTNDVDKELLLEGISSIDNADGDISDRIVIEKILEDEKNSRAVVYYAVCDYSGNVNKASREFKASYSKHIKDAEDSE